MSAAAIPVVSKVVTGAIVGKAVGKVTGNDKLGILAALGTGFAAPGGAIAEKTGGLLTQGVDLIKENPETAKLAGYGVKGAVDLYGTKRAEEEAEKAATIQHERNLAELQESARLQEEAAKSSYDRTRQGFEPRTRGGMLTEANTEVPRSAADEYYTRYLDMYSGGVR